MSYGRFDTEYVTVWGNGGDDSLTINAYSSTTNFRLFGGNGTDTLVIGGQDSVGGETFNHSPADATFGYITVPTTNGPAWMSYGRYDTEAVSLWGNAGNDTFNLTSSDNTTFTVHGGAQSDTLNIVPPPSGTRTNTGPGAGFYTFPNPYKPIDFTGMETLNP
jgi:hypothetical protein